MRMMRGSEGVDGEAVCCWVTPLHSLRSVTVRCSLCPGRPLAAARRSRLLTLASVSVIHKANVTGRNYKSMTKLTSFVTNGLETTESLMWLSSKTLYKHIFLIYNLGLTLFKINKDELLLQILNDLIYLVA